MANKMTTADQKKESHWVNGNVTEELLARTSLTDEQLDFNYDVDEILNIVKSEVGIALEFVTTMLLDKERLVDLWKSKGVYYVTRIYYDEGVVEMCELA